MKNEYVCTATPSDFVFSGEHSMLDAMSAWYRIERSIRERANAAHEQPSSGAIAFAAMRFAEVESLQKAVKRFGLDVWDRGLCEIDRASEVRGLRSNTVVMTEIPTSASQLMRPAARVTLLSYSMAGRTMVTFDVDDIPGVLASVSLVCESGGKGERSGSQSLYGTARAAIHVIDTFVRLWGEGAIKMSPDDKVRIAGT